MKRKAQRGRDEKEGSKRKAQKGRLKKEGMKRKDQKETLVSFIYLSKYDLLTNIPVGLFFPQ